MTKALLADAPLSVVNVGVEAFTRSVSERCGVSFSALANVGGCAPGMRMISDW